MAHQEKRGDRRTNRLVREKSPYLLQHAHNPVDWFPWGEDAFETARRLDRPVFLSIGYATCHWCHVMEKESFENPEVAELMNRAFVPVKVDREERPDLDHIYMTVCQMLTGSGGWPLTIVMTPEKHPFFAATYIPPTARYGRAGMVELIPRLQDVWENRRDEVMDSAGKILSALETAASPEGEVEVGTAALDRAFEALSGSFDARHGGFGKAPKFPSPHNLLFLLRYWKRTGNVQALEMVEATLTAMRRGGLFDHVGFGFHRYATDETWLVPHFEKMLYDQAMLAMAYVEAWQATGKPACRKTAEEVFAYVLRD
ncbi:MAG: thioredoxin domain-containing protein, partial [Deltaproteobacteria bacterium]|nr:thioredoxin domain-containing protein [Deltaproteobacteria bacterium]